jgi:hypothetical protein
MGEQRRSGSRSPHSIAAVASSLVLLVGFGVGAYFVELRGMGIQALLASEQLSEILIVCGVVAVFALVAQIAIAGSIGSASSSGFDRRLLRRVLEMDPEDPELLDDSHLPGDMRQLVRTVSTEKARAREATHQLQILRQEINELAKGMERSVETRDPLREEQASETTARVARLWNGLMAESQENGASPARVIDTEASPLTTGVGAAAVGVVSRDLDDVSHRLGRLEGDLEKLWDVVGGTGDAPRTHSPDSVLDLQRPELSPSFATEPGRRNTEIPSEFGPPASQVWPDVGTPPALARAAAADELEMPVSPPVSDTPELETPKAFEASGVREFDLSEAVDEVAPLEHAPQVSHYAAPPTELVLGAPPEVQDLTEPMRPPPAVPPPAVPRPPDSTAFDVPEFPPTDGPESGFHEWGGIGADHDLGSLLRQEIESPADESEAPQPEPPDARSERSLCARSREGRDAVSGLREWARAGRPRRCHLRPREHAGVHTDDGRTRARGRVPKASAG